MKSLIFSLLVIFLINFSIHSQQTVVQTFTFDSVSRSMMADFPEGDHLQYEKILMYYTMRCKDGLVSTGADRNLGCGEWDYSCNTYITDSSKVDSFVAFAPSHVINGYSDSEFDYSVDPTYSYYQSSLKEVVYNNTNSEEISELDMGSQILTYPLGEQVSDRKSQFLYKVDDLVGAGLVAGDLTGIRLPITSGSGKLPRLRVLMAAVTEESLDGSTIDDDRFTEVFYNNVEVTGAELFLKFHRDFAWDGTSNILIELSYSSASGNDIVLEGGNTDYAASFTCNGDQNSAMYSEGGTYLDLANDFNYEGEEISVSFWFKGGESLPTNSTLFEGLDSAGRRQMNVHMTWGDGKLYWDCGNDGGGYDRISKAVDESLELKEWNHWTLTKNAMTGFMRIYLNGEPWSVGLSKRNAISIEKLYFGRSANGNTRYYGAVDNFRIFDKELTPAEIKSMMRRTSYMGSDLYSHLMLDYDFNQSEQGPVVDLSGNMHEATVVGTPDDIYSLGRFIRNEAQVDSTLPDIVFVSGDYDRTVSETSVLDSLENSPYFIEEYSVVDNDLVFLSEYSYYLAGFTYLYDENGDILDLVLIPADGTITIEHLEYYNKRPSKFEIMSFVTPYGIGIDFGLEGKTWIFDVTDFGPVLKGKKRISLERGGQNQEEMDIKFVFVEGTPIRDVHSIQQVWPVTAEGYNRIIDNVRFEERKTTLSQDASAFALKAAITGHGQEGEFIPRVHYLNVNGGAREREWQVWTECADNPIYPQGGTWIYDRAGWCPGAPTDVEIVPLDDVNPGEEITIDYGVNNGSGDSRYIVNVQLLSYGEPNFNNDASVIEIINPSSMAAHERFNPMCGVPRVVIKNTGEQELTSVDIAYGVQGRGERRYTWNGNLEFLEEEIVDLPPIGIDRTVSGMTFYARVENPNNQADDYAANDEMTSVIPEIAVHKNGLVVEMRTNSAANETSWKLLDQNGNEIAGRAVPLTSNTLYRDTIQNLEGCYELLVEDTDDDGISFWANSDGNGFVQIRDLGGGITSVATDFGKYVSYEFVTEGYVKVEDENQFSEALKIYPNPGYSEFTIQFPTGYEGGSISIVNRDGKMVKNFARDYFYSNTMQVDLSDIESGIYIVHYISENKISTGKFVKL